MGTGDLPKGRRGPARIGRRPAEAQAGAAPASCATGRQPTGSIVAAEGQENAGDGHPERRRPASRVGLDLRVQVRQDHRTLHYPDTDLFIDDLRSALAFTDEAMEANVQLSPAVFDACRSNETARSLVIVRALRGVWLDNAAASCRTRSSPPCSRGSAWSQ